MVCRYFLYYTIGKFEIRCNMKNKHKFITASDKPISGAISFVGFYLMEYYLKEHNFSRKRWKKERKEVTMDWHVDEGVQEQSKPFNYLMITKYIREKGYFNNLRFHLPPLFCFWLDESIDFKIDWHRLDTSPDGLTAMDGTTEQQFGKNYPIKPSIDREGHLFSTFQPQILERVGRQRTRLIETSENVLTDEWVFDFRSLINDTISLVDITLTQIYIKAEFDPLEGWRFNKEKLGNRQGRRLADKLKWIYKITGNHLGAEKYMPSFNELRMLRNHLMHFDPPSLVITIEEIVKWLNQIIDVGYLLIKIRIAIGVPVYIQLLNLVLLKEAVFKPLPKYSNRIPLNKTKYKTGYKSTMWPENS